jgi:hypothetical protein
VMAGVAEIAQIVIVSRTHCLPIPNKGRLSTSDCARNETVDISGKTHVVL